MAFGDATQGILLLNVILNLARNLSQVAVAVHRDPALFKGGPPRQKPRDFVEQAANTLRDAFIKCLAADGQTTSTSRTTRPAETDKRFGIYVTANACLKVLFASRKLRNAQQVFLSIDAQSPALSLYPAAQRVTYLYVSRSISTKPSTCTLAVNLHILYCVPLLRANSKSDFHTIIPGLFWFRSLY